jgi:hypothetical protein
MRRISATNSRPVATDSQTNEQAFAPSVLSLQVCENAENEYSEKLNDEDTMKRSSFALRYFSAILPLAVAAAQVSNVGQPAGAPPVSYASLSQVNQLSAQLEQTSQTVQSDLTKLRINRWKTDYDTKRQVQSNVDSIQRNLQGALPEMLTQLRSSPENLPATFKVYRNLAALYDVFSSVVESAGAFGSKDEFQSLENDLTALDQSRRLFGDRLENIAGAKEAELARLRTQVQQAQPPPVAQPAKKVIVDDSEASKKPAKKKPMTKPGNSAANPAPQAGTSASPAPTTAAKPR